MRIVAIVSALSLAWFLITGCDQKQATETPFSISQLQEWREDIRFDSVNWEPLVEEYRPAWGYSPVTGDSIDENHRSIKLWINCEENLPGVKKAIQERLPVLGIPAKAVEFRVVERERLDIQGFNALVECEPLNQLGFGGYYLDIGDESVVYVYLLQPSQEAAEEMALFQLGPVPWNEKRTVLPLQGQYTYLQLEDWYQRLYEDVITGEDPQLTMRRDRYKDQPKLVSSGVSTYWNRLYFAINPEADKYKVRQALEERLAALDIPLEATVIEVEPPR